MQDPADSCPPTPITPMIPFVPASPPADSPPAEEAESHRVLVNGPDGPITVDVLFSDHAPPVIVEVPTEDPPVQGPVNHAPNDEAPVIAVTGEDGSVPGATTPTRTPPTGTFELSLYHLCRMVFDIPGEWVS